MGESARRIRTLIELATPRDLPETLPADKYLQVINEIYQLANGYIREGNQEKAFVMFLRFCAITVEELPKHNVFANLTAADVNIIDAKTIEAMTTAEALKNSIRARYEQEEANGAVSCALASNAECSSTSASFSTSSLGGSGGGGAGAIQMAFNSASLLEDVQLGPYGLCNLLSVQPIVFQRIVIPNNLPPTFMSAAPDGGEFHFAFLYGRLVRNSLIASHIVFAREEELTSNPPTLKRYISDDEGESLPLVGYIGSKFVEVAHFHDVCHLSEMVCVICPPGANRSLVLHLVSVPASLMGGRHSNDASQGAASYSGCSHLHITNSISCTIHKESG